MAYNPMAGQDDSTENWGWGMSPDLIDVSQLPPAPPRAPAPNVPAPGNDANQIQGWAQEYLGRNFTDADIAGLNGQPLGLVMNGIANSPEADAYNKAHQLGNYAVLPQPAKSRSSDGSSGGGSAPAPPNYADLFSAAPNPMAGQNTANHDALMSSLMSLANSGGGFNQDIVNRRNESAKETLARQRSSTLKNDQAYLADRGLVGSGPETDALNYLDTNVGNAYANAVSTNYANESQNADARMMSALQTATGLNENDAANIINSYQAQTARALGLGNYDLGVGNLALGNTNAANNFALGQGNLALGNVNAANSYNLGLADYGLRRDTALSSADNQSLSQLMQLIQQLMSGAQASAGGYF